MHFCIFPAWRCGIARADAKKKRIRQALTLAPLLFLSLVVSCTEAPRETPGLKIGVLIYSGDQAQSCCGDATLNVVEMVRAQVEKAGGVMVGRERIPVSIFVSGIRNRPEEAVSGAQHLINQAGVQVLIGPQHSGDAIPVAKIAEESGTLMISPMSTSPETTAGKSAVFRIGFIDDFQGDALARFAYTDLGVRRAAVLYDKAKPYSHGIAERFASSFSDLGGSVVANGAYVTGRTDFSHEIDLIMKAAPELILLPNHNNDVLLQGPQIRERGGGVTLLGTDAWDEQQLAPMPEFEGAYKVAHWSEAVDLDKNRKFVREYTARFGEAPNNTAALTRDAFEILFEAAAAADSTGADDLAEALYDLPPFEGLSGLIDYTVSGDPLKSAVILKLNGGGIEFRKMYVP